MPPGNPLQRRLGEGGRPGAWTGGPGGGIARRGDPDGLLAGGGVVAADYAVAMAAHAAIEPMVATARSEDGGVEVWAPTQAPQLMRAAVARATGLSEARGTIYPTLHGGSIGREPETDAAEQAAATASKI